MQARTHTHPLILTYSAAPFQHTQSFNRCFLSHLCLLLQASLTTVLQFKDYKHLDIPKTPSASVQEYHIDNYGPSKLWIKTGQLVWARKDTKHRQVWVSNKVPPRGRGEIPPSVVKPTQDQAQNRNLQDSLQQKRKQRQARRKDRKFLLDVVGPQVRPTALYRMTCQGAAPWNQSQPLT